jgi:hypothetical protein
MKFAIDNNTDDLRSNLGVAHSPFHDVVSSCGYSALAPQNPPN